MAAANVQSTLVLLISSLQAALDMCEENKDRATRGGDGGDLGDEFIGLVGIMFLTTGVIFTEGYRITERTTRGRDIVDFGNQSIFGGG